MNKELQNDEGCTSTFDILRFRNSIYPSVRCEWESKGIGYRGHRP